MSKAIVVGVDGQPQSAAALDWAITEAVRRCSPLMVLHAGQAWSQPATSSRSLLEQTHGQQLTAEAVAVVHAMNRDIRVSSIIVPGDPSDVLASWASDASMIVLGNRGRGPVTAAVRGSVSATVAAHAHCPVIVIGTPAGQRAPVVVGVDGSPASTDAIEFAFDYAARQGTWVRAVHTWHLSALPGTGDLATQRTAHLRVVTDALTGARDRYPHVPVRVTRPIGRATEILADESIAAQLLVVGTHGHGPRSSLLLGSVSQTLLHTANCPLAVIPPEDRP
jgi:nucleotide-binding universal stress UspA family protein